MKEAYDYIMNKCGSHYLANNGLFTAHITLGMDYQKYGNSEWEAKDTLATYLSTKKQMQDMVIQLNKQLL